MAESNTGTANHRTKGLSVYIHVPFCAVRCGYCDFNTYTALELGGGGSQAEYPNNAIKEMDLTLAADQAAGFHYEQVSTVFFGGGTPTLLPAADQIKILKHLKSLIPFAEDIEVTTEANPDSVTQESLRELAAAGFNRVSFGMQSAVPRVLQILDRTHNPQSVPQAVKWAKEAGLEVSLDMIYGTPTETLADVNATLDAVLGMQPNHVSAYSLIVEGNTKMNRQLRRGEITQPDPDFMADAYELISERLAADDFNWYEVSNFAKAPEFECRHNRAYWAGTDWWGIGPGAHRHRDGYRAWNVKHPSRYAGLLSKNELPVDGWETVGYTDRAIEALMLGLRVRDGLNWAELLPSLQADPEFSASAAEAVIAGYVKRDMLVAKSWEARKLQLTDGGRLLADAIVRDILTA